MPEKHRSHEMQRQVSEMEVGALRAPDAPTPRMELDKLGKTNGHRNVDLRSNVLTSKE